MTVVKIDPVPRMALRGTEIVNSIYKAGNGDSI